MTRPNPGSFEDVRASVDELRLKAMFYHGLEAGYRFRNIAVILCIGVGALLGYALGKM